MLWFLPIRTTVMFSVWRVRVGYRLCVRCTLQIHNNLPKHLCLKFANHTRYWYLSWTEKSEKWNESWTRVALNFSFSVSIARAKPNQQKLRIEIETQPDLITVDLDSTWWHRSVLILFCRVRVSSYLPIPSHFISNLPTKQTFLISFPHK